MHGPDSYPYVHLTGPLASYPTCYYELHSSIDFPEAIEFLHRNHDWGLALHMVGGVCGHEPEKC